MITVFYDAQCPLCSMEMRHLKKHDKANRVRLVDINSAEMREEFPEIDIAEANRILHGYDDQGYLIRGLDVTVAAWRAVGKGYRVAFLRWPGVSRIADKGYRWFADNRHTISRLVAGKARCDCGTATKQCSR